MKGSHSPFERGKTLCKADLLCLAALARCAGTPKLQPQQQQQCKKQSLACVPQAATSAGEELKSRHGTSQVDEMPMQEAAGQPSLFQTMVRKVL